MVAGNSPTEKTNTSRCGNRYLWSFLASFLGAVATCQAEGPAPQASPIRFQSVERESPDGWMRGMAAWIDCQSTRIEYEVTEPLSVPIDGADAKLKAVDEWARELELHFAINDNFFGWKANGYADVIGLSLADGILVSLARSHDGVLDSVFVILKTGQATIWPRGEWTEERLEQARFAVSGIGPTETRPQLSGPILWMGKNRGDRAQVQPSRRHPRTAIGVSQSGRFLIALVIDGRQQDWSVGATLPELADWMLDLGAWSALNLDGGGSSSMMVRDPAHPDRWLSNRPSDASGFRPVANHFGARVRAE